MNKWDKEVSQVSSQEEAAYMREKLSRQLLSVEKNLQCALSGLTQVGRQITKSRASFTKHSLEVKKFISEAVYAERARIARALYEQGWTFKKIDELFGRRGGNSSRVWILHSVPEDVG